MIYKIAGIKVKMLFFLVRAAGAPSTNSFLLTKQGSGKNYNKYIGWISS